MTIIAATRTHMAADRVIRWGDNAPFYTKKIVRIGASLIGWSGNVDAALKFLEWRERFEEWRGDRRKTRPDPPVWKETGDDADDFDALELRADGLYLWDPSCYPVVVLEPCYAIGSISPDIAIHHMRSGKMPKRAVEMSMRHQRIAVTPIDEEAL